MFIFVYYRWVLFLFPCFLFFRFSSRVLVVSKFVCFVVGSALYEIEWWWIFRRCSFVNLWRGSSKLFSLILEVDACIWVCSIFNVLLWSSFKQVCDSFVSLGLLMFFVVGEIDYFVEVMYWVERKNHVRLSLGWYGFTYNFPIKVGTSVWSMHPRSVFRAIEVVCQKMLVKVNWDLTIFMSRYFPITIQWFPVLEAFR